MKYLVVGVFFLLVGCASSPEIGTTSDTMRIIEAAAKAAPDGVRGEFEFYIRASGRQGGVVYLNTEEDYRDRRNVSIVIQPQLAQLFERKLGQSPEELFVNKSIRVSGEANQVQIFFFSYGRQTNKYYFQTHINVNRPEQIQVI